jgi:hypothetical protein
VLGAYDAIFLEYKRLTEWIGLTRDTNFAAGAFMTLLSTVNVSLAITVVYKFSSGALPDLSYAKIGLALAFVVLGVLHYIRYRSSNLQMDPPWHDDNATKYSNPVRMTLAALYPIATIAIVLLCQWTMHLH